MTSQNRFAVRLGEDRLAGLTARQGERTERVIMATETLARQGGYEGVRMREVSVLSGVALGTIYRYFGSREYLVYLATQRWAQRTTVAAIPPDLSGSTAELCLRQLRSVGLAYAAEPLLLEAWVRSIISADPAVIDEARRTGEDQAVAAAMWPPLNHLDRTFEAVLRMSVGQVWFAGVVQWASGQKTLAEVHGEVERLVRFLFGTPAAPAARADPGS
jgi:TetR/AcrR family transcriptional regulator, cholesterol catabolism regulator